MTPSGTRSGDDRGTVSRRVLIGIGLGVPALALLGRTAAAETAPCVNLETLPMSQKGMRRAINFKLQSPDPKKTCAGCSFFTAAAGSDCGKCQMLSGGAVSAGSICDSFARKS